jgi:amino acid adenylation domain-containing protein
MHHIIGDGWSFSILIKEFSALYEAFVSDRSAGLVDLPIQYADFAVWQRSWLQGDVLENQLDYWRRQLDSLTTLELPLDFPRPAVASHKGRMITFQINDELTGKLKRVSRQHSATLFITLLAAFQVLLSRYSNQSDVAVGTDIANRNLLDTESLIGFFVNQLVLRADLSANPSFIELLQQVRRTALDAYAHQDLPFEKLVDELQPQRDLSRAPLFQVKLVLQNAAGVDLQLPALRISSLEEQHQVAKFDLTFIFEESSSSLKGSLEFATDLFSSTTAQRIVSHFCALLQSITDDPSQRVRDLSLITQEERNQVLFDFNDTSRSFPWSSGVHQLFQSQAEVSPEAIAVVSGDQFLTYRQFNEQTNQLAHYLQSLGVGAEVRVAVYMERSIEMIVALLSILKAGGAYVPIDPDYPMERVAWLLEDSQCPVLLTQERLQDSLPSIWAHVLCVDSEWEEVRSFSTHNPDTFITSDNLAYVMYTSGSTGSPKGVEVTHKSIVRLLMSTDYAQFGPSLAFLQISPPSFDASTLEIWAPLLHGGRCILYPERIPVPERLAEFILDHKVNSAWLTSSLFNVVMDETPLALAPLQQLLIGGEALSVSHVSKAVQMLGSTCLINGYGPTEGTTFTCCYRIPAEPGTLIGIRSVPIGSAISNTRVYILDSEYEPVPIGVPGELFIAGDGLARGYLNQPALTAEKFLPNPFSQETGGRLYRTGDMAQWRADGTVEYLGRIDHQVKLRGYRIELGEIESNLRSNPVVQDVAVLLREDVVGDKRLVAYIIPSSPSWEDPGNLRAYLQQMLPDYMVPAHFVVLDEMPLTPNGKLDRRALPAPDTEDVQTGLYVEPSNATEQAMCEVWQEVLKLDRVGIEDNFFSLGGDSILSIQVVSMLKSRDIVVDIKDIFKHQTIAELAAQIGPGRPEQETFIGTNQIAHLLINEGDELGANVRETLL